MYCLLLAHITGCILMLQTGWLLPPKKLVIILEVDIAADTIIDVFTVYVLTGFKVNHGYNQEFILYNI